jgi:hypothetical protein
MSAIAATATTVTDAASELHLNGGGIVQPKTGGIETIAGGRAAANDGPGGIDPVAGPRKGEATIGAPESTAPIANLEQVIAGLRRGFRTCYETKGLALDPNMSGKVMLRVKIAPNGEVRGVDRISNAGLSDAVVTCIERRLEGATFAPPGSAGSVVQVPVAFAKQ